MGEQCVDLTDGSASQLNRNLCVFALGVRQGSRGLLDALFEYLGCHLQRAKRASEIVCQLGEGLRTKGV